MYIRIFIEKMLSAERYSCDERLYDSSVRDNRVSNYGEENREAGMD